MSEDNLRPDYHQDFYQHMRDGIRGWLQVKGVNYRFADYLLALPDLFHLLCRLVVDKEIPAVEKAKLAAAIVYIISPGDLLPEALVGPVGYADDVVVAALALDRLVNKTSPEIVKRHWAGHDDVLGLVQQILLVASEMIGMGVWAQVRKRFGKAAA